MATSIEYLLFYYELLSKQAKNCSFVNALLLVFDIVKGRGLIKGKFFECGNRLQQQLQYSRYEKQQRQALQRLQQPFANINTIKTESTSNIKQNTPSCKRKFTSTHAKEASQTR
ncbi:hypothetical protein K501DRAFT_270942 [Backusella circina FSU 941]|nr:hypothetical protein K501DRAFT_270942 [Backusella circina FSU 941]